MKSMRRLLLYLFFLELHLTLVSARCSSCTECRVTSNSYQLCQCDSRYYTFNRECYESEFNLSTCEAENVVPSGVNLVCRSVYVNREIKPSVNESFWMVSSCPGSWLSEDPTQALVRDSCVSLNSSLPPITDLDTGIVYANEYCAICNRVENLAAWQSNLVCNQYLYRKVEQNSLADLVVEDLQNNCQTCSYQVPELNNILTKPRPCLPVISTCASKSQLEVLTENTYSEQTYQQLVEDCFQGPLDVVTFSDNDYKNEACAFCNGINDTECYIPTLRVGISCECVPPEPPTNPPTTEAPFMCPPPQSLLEIVKCAEREISERTQIDFGSGSGLDLPPSRELATLIERYRNNICTEHFPAMKLNNILFKVVGQLKKQNLTIKVFECDNASISMNESIADFLTRIKDEVSESLNPPGIVAIQTNYPPITPYTISLVNINNGEIRVSIDTQRITTLTMNCPEGQAALGLECTSTMCAQSYVENGGQCNLSFIQSTNSTANVSCERPITLNTSDYALINSELMVYNNQVYNVLGVENGVYLVCLNQSADVDDVCLLEPIEVTSNIEIIRLGNHTIEIGGERINVVKFDKFGTPFGCNDTSIVINVTFLFPEGHFIASTIGSSLSVIGCAFILLTYGVFKSLRTLPSLIISNLAVAILANSLIFLIGGPINQAVLSPHLCGAMAIFLHFSFLAQFTWMIIMSMQMVRTFYRAGQMKSTSPKEDKKLLLVYLIAGWSIPLLITTVSVIANFTTDNLVLYGVRENGQIGFCWINHHESAIVAFLVPLILTVVINLILFVVATVLLCLAARNSSKVGKSRTMIYLRVNLALLSSTSLGWIFGFIALLAGTEWAWYPFIIFNSSQGFAIFLTFLLTKHILKLYWDLLWCQNNGPITSKSSKSSKVKNSHDSVLLPSK